MAKGLEKLLRPFQRKLTPEETYHRIVTTQTVITALKDDTEWSNFITGAIIFGSTTLYKAKTGSDVDLAILTLQDFYLGGDYSWITGNLLKSIIAIQIGQGNDHFAINPTIVAENWLNNPELTPNPELFNHIISYGIKIL